MSEPVAFAAPQDWWDWLASHPDAREVWVLFHRKGSGTPSIDWNDAVIGALAHGWIDGVKKSLDETRWLQRFTPRKPSSAWSARNIAHVERLTTEGSMTEAGLAVVATAKAKGLWDNGYSGGKGAEVPQDFLDALALGPQAAQAAYASLSSKNRYAIYYRLTTAKRPETRAKRIADHIAMLARGETFY